MWNLIDTYLQNRAQNTQIAYNFALRDWCGYLKAKPYTREAWRRVIRATPKDAEGYVGEISQRTGMDYGGKTTLAPNTVRLRVAVLRRVYSILVQCGKVKSNPFVFTDVRLRKGALKRQAAIVDFEIVPEFVRAPDAASQDGVRDRAFFALLFGAGLRISEVRNLRCGDVLVSPDGYLILRLIDTKTADEETQIVSPWAAELVSKLVSRRRNEGATEGDYLVVGYRGERRTPQIGRVTLKTLYRWFTKWRRICGLPPNVTPHSGRVTAVSKLLAEGYKPREVQEFSRHSDIRMVHLYDRRRRGAEENCGVNLKY